MEKLRVIRFWVAQPRGPQQARFWLDWVERFTAAITRLDCSMETNSLPISTPHIPLYFPALAHGRESG